MEVGEGYWQRAKALLAYCLSSGWPHARSLRCVLSTCCAATPPSAAAQPSATWPALGGTTCTRG